MENILLAAKDINYPLVDLKPTHYAIILFPRNENELNEMLARKDIVTSFIPFGFTLAQVNHSNSCKDNIFVSECKYYYNDPASGASKKMPPLYAKWPVSVPVSDTYDYTIAYNLFIPNYSSLTNNTNDKLLQLENQAIQHIACLDNPVRGSSNRTISGRIFDLDSVLGNNVSVKNLRMRLQYGLNIMETYTDAGGYFSFSGVINDNATLYAVFENDRWRICLNSLISYSLPLGTVSDCWGQSSYHYFYTNFDYMPIHRGANFFFHGNHEVATPSCNYAIRIKMSQVVFGENYFQSSVLLTPFIEICDFHKGFDGRFVSDVCHELGHFQHYLLCNSNYSTYTSIPLFIRESYASYTSWSLSREYYQSLNASYYNTNWEIYLGPDRQVWLPSTSYGTDSENYSPLFIDLIDDYNQYLQTTPYHTYLDDSIVGCPHSWIESLITTSSTMGDLYDNLTSKIGYYYTQSAFWDYFTPYMAYFF